MILMNFDTGKDYLFLLLFHLEFAEVVLIVSFKFVKGKII